MEGRGCNWVPGNDAWTNLPYLNWNRDDRQFKLNANYASNQNDNWSVPSFRESSIRINHLLHRRWFIYCTDLSQPPNIFPTSDDTS
jgi:hypothetical protein